VSSRPLLLAAALAVALASIAAGCGGDDAAKGDRGTLTIVVNAPFSRTPYVGTTIDHGVSLGARDVNDRGGIAIGGRPYDLRVKRLDNGLSPRRALQNVRRAVDDGAIAIVDEGTGIDATWPVAERAGVPIGIVYQGGEDLVDAGTRPNVFRIAPSNHGLAFRLAEYLVPKGLKVALLHDDSDYGEGGAASLRKAFSHNPEAVAADIAIPAGALDVAPQVLRARRAGATALLVWGLPGTIAAAITAARTSGWDVPVYTPPSGADPLVRQQLADHPSWIDGLTFASGRLTAEQGPGPYLAFQQRYTDVYGAEKVGVRTSTGSPVYQPPEFAMYAYDFVQVLAAALQSANSTKPADVTRALEQVSVRGVNGDDRGFNERSHEGVVDDDVYFARFHDMTFAPVEDDPLSSTLPDVPQVR
jgi:ABC-type branched-subunit amino acid transport system substrate-binding protein